MQIIPLDIFQANLNNIRTKIRDACKKTSRDPEEIRIMAVTKTFPPAYIDVAVKGGISLFGENRVQEAREKYKDIHENIELHLIGHLQRNKAKIAAEIFHCVQSIDKYETAFALNSHAEKLGRTISILIEINTTSEESKFGIREQAEFWNTMDKISVLENLSIRGLMTVGPFTQDKDAIRASFSALRGLFLQTKDQYPGLSLDVLSMGMSSDFDIAVEEGSTLVRIGTALFGERSYLHV